MENILENLQKVKIASDNFKNLSFEKRNKIIKEIWDSIRQNKEIIKKENQKDLSEMDKKDPMYDRLLLTDERIELIAKWCYDLVNISDPLSKYDNENVIKTDSGLTIRKTWVPLWVVACIYESRPNVTVDIAIMCIKSANWVVLRWWRQAQNSNIVFIKLIKEVLIKNDINPDLVYNYPTNREELNILYNAVWLVDVLIPRGWKKLIESVRDNSKVPVIETWAWVVHLYLDDDIETENISKAIDVVVNAKTQRISVCNALDTLIINKNVSEKLLKELFEKLKEKKVTFWVLESQIDIIKKYISDYEIIDKNDFNKEQLSLNLHVVFVNNLEEAISHISKYSSKHSDWILSDNKEKINSFIKNIDSSVVYSNTSTRFSDGSYFWFWWEIWISTQKLHARWPMWSDSLVIYKYVVESDWGVR